MLIIFDLDDTLLETTASIAPFKLRQFFKEVSKNEPSLSGDEVEILLRLNQGSQSSLNAILEYLEIKGFSSSVSAQFLQVFKKNGDFPEEIQLVSGVKETLFDFVEQHHVAVVTRGKRETQLKKLQFLPVPVEEFVGVWVVEEGSKSTAYQEIQQKMGVHPFEVVVVGDRVDMDLLPAKQLGFLTVHMQNGRGLRVQIEKDGIVDYQICSLNQLSAIIQDIQIKNFLRIL